MAQNIPDELYGMLSQAIASHMGLHYPRDRWQDLERAMAKAAPSLGCEDGPTCLRRLAESPLSDSHVEILARHLTIGETHFFRHEKVFEILEQRILPELVAARRNSGKRLRMWSAGCATGEEPYSLAMVVRKTLPDLADWNVTILGSDINGDFLKKAEQGIYSQWSFRSVPPGIKERFFVENGERSEVNGPVKAMVKFATINLAKDDFPALSSDTHSMDMIFCRNVLMYFTPDKQQEVLGKLFQSLAEGGWLVVSPAEAAVILHPNLVTTSFSGAVLYRKDSSWQGRPSHLGAIIPDPLSKREHRPEHRSVPFSLSLDAASTSAPEATFQPAAEFQFLQPLPSPGPAFPAASAFQKDSAQDSARPLARADRIAPPGIESEPAESEITPYVEAVGLYGQGLYSDAVAKLLEQLDRRRSQEATSGTAMALLARSYANLGRLDEAMKWAERTIAADKLNSDYHFLHGTILQEQGKADQAMASLRRAVFLEPKLVVAHFALGTLARQQGKLKDCERHYRNALKILCEYDEQAHVPSSEGMTAGRLTDMILAMTPKEVPNGQS